MKKINILNFGLPILLALAGFGFFCLGAGKIYLNQIYAQKGKEGLARVTVYTSRRTPSSVSSSDAEYQFTTADGREIKGHQNGYHARVGEEVKIEYLPDNPEWNRVSGAGRLNENWNLPMAVGGLLFFAAGIYAFIQAFSAIVKPLA